LKKFFILIFISLQLLTAGCLTKQKVSAHIIDGNGNPVTGALLYYESYTNDGSLDFGYSFSGDNGEVPPEGEESLFVNWSNDARIAFAVFKENMKTTVLYTQSDLLSPTDALISIRDYPEGEMKWEPRLGKLSFPFEENDELYQRLKNGNTSDLVEVFYRDYLLLKEDNIVSFDWEQRKMEIIAELNSIKSK
jgi:hypothetical protein